MKKTLEQRFLDKVIIPNDRDACWEWRGSKSHNGYPQLGGWRLNRLSYLMFNGNLEQGKEILHTCDNRSCTNPNHLKQDTHQANMQDCSNKGRNPMQAKTHCPQGHEYIEENTRNTGNKRKCRTCARDYMRRKRASK